MPTKKITFYILMFFAFGFLNAQSYTYNGNPDESIVYARELAYLGDRTRARDTLEQVLTKYPDYIDVRNLMAKTYSWDGNYNEARKHFNRIISDEKKHEEVWLSAIRNEIYAKNYTTAIGLSNKAQIYVEEDYKIIELKQQALNEINKSVEEIIIEEDKEEVVSEIATDSLPKDKITLFAGVDVFDQVFDPMYNTSLSYSKETKYGTIIPRVNYSNRFNTSGTQFEIDAYPKFSKKTYGYLNYGFSDSEIFPTHRAGAELYVNLPKAMEVSLGARMLDFETDKVFIYTGSFGMYSGNYFFSLRPYVTPADNNKFNVSGNLLIRKYLKDKHNYFGLNASYGVATDLKQFKNDDVVLAETLLYLESQQLLFEYQFTGKKNPNALKVTLGATRQEIGFDPGNYFIAGTFGLTYDIKF